MDSNPLVHVIDDDGDIREMLLELLRSVHIPVATYACAEEFLDRTAPDTRGCAIVDVRMPGMGGLELQQTMKAGGYLMPIVFLTGYGDVSMAVRALQEGAVGFMEKPFRHQDFLDLVRRALELDSALREAASERQAVAERLATLTPREREILDLVIAGKGSAEIALRLDISAKTVEGHRGSISKKLGTSSVVELVRMMEVYLRGSDHPFRLMPQRIRRPDRQRLTCLAS